MIRRGLKSMFMIQLYREQFTTRQNTIYVKIQGTATEREFMPKANCQI